MYIYIYIYMYVYIYVYKVSMSSTYLAVDRKKTFVGEEGLGIKWSSLIGFGQ